MPQIPIAKETTSQEIKTAVNTVNTTANTVNTKTGTNTDAAGTTTVFGRLRQIYDYLTGTILTAINGRQASWGATATHSARIDANISTRAAQTTANDILTKVNSISGGGRQVFTSNGTFTVPTGVTSIYITACASGGNGGSATTYGSGGGGAGGEVYKLPIVVTAGQNIGVTVGSGNTVFGSFFTLIKGGNGGNGDSSGAIGGIAGNNSDAHGGKRQKAPV